MNAIFLVGTKVTLLLAALSASLITFGSSYEWSENLKANYRKGFLLTCQPTIESQLKRAGLLQETAVSKRISYCTCVGIKIFDDLTLDEVRDFQKTKQLPKRKEVARARYSEECADKLL